MAVPDVWRSGSGLTDLARSFPSALVDQVEGLLDKVAARAVEAPLDVRTVEDVRACLSEAPSGAGGAASWLTALAGKSKRTLSWRGRAIPLSVATKLGTEVLGSFRLGAYELEILASLLVHRLRDAGLPVDARAVQRAAVNAYVWPAREPDALRRREVPPTSLGALWVGRMLAVEPAVGRVTKAAESLLALDRGGLERVSRVR